MTDLGINKHGGVAFLERTDRPLDMTVVSLRIFSVSCVSLRATHPHMGLLRLSTVACGTCPEHPKEALFGGREHAGRSTTLMSSV